MCHYIESDPNIERAYFAKAFQEIEDVKIRSEEDGSVAWDICRSYDRVRQDNERLYGDRSPQAVHKYLAQEITFAAGSGDYACRETDKNHKGAADTLLAFDKVMGAECDYILQTARHKHGTRSVLTQLSKLVILCQRSGADLRKVRWMICWCHHRMIEGSLARDCPASELRNKVLPVGLLTYEMINEFTSGIVYPKNPDESDSLDSIWVRAASANPLWTAHARSGKDRDLGNLIDLTNSAKSIVKWFESLCRGEDDGALREMVENR